MVLYTPKTMMSNYTYAPQKLRKFGSYISNLISLDKEIDTIVLNGHWNASLMGLHLFDDVGCDGSVVEPSGSIIWTGAGNC